LKNQLSFLKFSENCVKFCKQGGKILKIREIRNAVVRLIRSRKNMKNEASVVKFGVDTAENERRKGFEKWV